MRRDAIQKAMNDLEEAEIALAGMIEWTDFNFSKSSGNTVADNNKIYRAFTRNWHSFLYASARIFNALEKGARGNNSSEPWMGRVAHVRRNDELLRYIRQVSNCHDHGLIAITANQGIRAISVHPRVTIEPDGVTINLPEDFPVGTVFAQFLGPAVRLISVHDDLHDNTFAVPTEHLGEKLPDSDPITVARLAIEYFKCLINDAEELCR